MTPANPIRKPLSPTPHQGPTRWNISAVWPAALTGEHIQLGRRFRLYPPRTSGRLRRHRRVELPDANRMLEGRTSAGLRQYDGVQAV